MGKTYLITGANRGIGLEFVRQLIARNDRVIATVRDPDRAGDLVKLDHALRIIRLDVADPNSINNLAGQVGTEPIDVLINNAGISGKAKSVANLDAAELQNLFMVNSTSPLLVTRAVLANLRAGPTKRIVHITSQLGSIANNTGGSTYSYRASKAALNMLNRSLSAELAPQGFTCVALHPGWVKTDMGGPNADLTPPDAVAHMLRTIDTLTPERTGAFLNYDGSPLPW